MAASLTAVSTAVNFSCAARQLSAWLQRTTVGCLGLKETEVLTDVLRATVQDFRQGPHRAFTQRTPGLSGGGPHIHSAPAGRVVRVMRVWS
jgi:hypothetical protein